MAGPWSDGQCGAVSLTFDDGLASQLFRAVPTLGRHGLRGTFYLNARSARWEEGLAPWADVAGLGHELGNHTLTHPCSGNFDFVPAGRGLEDLTLEDIAQDIDLCEERLRSVAGPGPRSFAYPCYQDFVGRGARRQSYVPLVAERFVAARARGERANDPARADLHWLWSFPCERMDAAQMIGLCETATARGLWCILTLHGIHEGGLAVAAEDLEVLCAHLAAQRTRIWTAPVAEVAGHVLAWRGRQAADGRR